MVSKASEDLPDPDRPVNTISALRGRSRWTFLRLCSRAPRMTRRSVALRFPSSAQGGAVGAAPTFWHPMLTEALRRRLLFRGEWVDASQPARRQGLHVLPPHTLGRCHGEREGHARAAPTPHLCRPVPCSHSLRTEPVPAPTTLGRCLAASGAG